MRVAIQGEPGSFSEEAARRYFGAVEIVPCRWFSDAFDAILAGRADAGAIPIENSQAGSINDTYDLLLQHNLPIVGEVDLPVRLCLLALPGVALADGVAVRVGVTVAVEVLVPVWVTVAVRVAVRVGVRVPV